MLDILAQSPRPQTIPELAKVMDINRATAWRLINTLLEFELVEKDGESGRFTVGSGKKMVNLAALQWAVEHSS